MWLAKIAKMMNELPEKYLQADPKELADSLPLPSGAKSAGSLTDEEIRLDGLYRQLFDDATRDAEAHRALHGPDSSQHPPEACLEHNKQMSIRDQEIQIVSVILLRSLGERLGFENTYLIKGHEVFIIPPVLMDNHNMDISGFGGLTAH